MYARRFTLLFMLALVHAIGCSKPATAPLDPALEHLLKSKAKAAKLDGIDAMSELLPIYAYTSYEATQSYKSPTFQNHPAAVDLSKWAEQRIQTNKDSLTYIKSVLGTGERAVRRGNMSLPDHSELIPAIYILPTIKGAEELEPQLQSIIAAYMENTANESSESQVVAAVIRSLVTITPDKKQLAQICAALIVGEANDMPSGKNASATFAAIDAIGTLGEDTEQVRDALDVAEKKWVGNDSKAKILKARKAIARN